MNTENMNKEALLKTITYTILPFIHVPFPSRIAQNLNQYTKIVNIGGNTLTVSFTSTDVLPSGIYSRRIFSFLCKSIILSHRKDQIINLPHSKSQFLKEIFKRKTIRSSSRHISKQLKALTDCNITINYSNSNYSSQKPYISIKLFTGDCSFLYDDNQDWQSEITLSNEMFELIKNTSVPISEHAVNTFTSARQIDVYNSLKWLSLKLTNQLFQEYEKLPKQAHRNIYNKLVYKINLNRTSSVPIELQSILEQLKTPSQQIINGIPIKYIYCLFWAWSCKKCIDTPDDNEHLILNLFKHFDK